jgi:cytochrome c peroxidase
MPETTHSPALRTNRVCRKLGGPKIPWRPGRIDGFEKDVTPDGRLPDAALGSDHIRNIFERMG